MVPEYWEIICLYFYKFVCITKVFRLGIDQPENAGRKNQLLYNEAKVISFLDYPQIPPLDSKYFIA